MLLLVKLNTTNELTPVVVFGDRDVLLYGPISKADLDITNKTCQNRLIHRYTDLSTEQVLTGQVHPHNMRIILDCTACFCVTITYRN